MREGELLQQLTIDREISNKKGFSVASDLYPETELVMTQYHGRGGARVGIDRRPTGSWLVLHENDVVYEFDETGVPSRRWIAGQPPNGYRLLPSEELQSMLQGVLDLTWPLEKGEVDIINLGK